MVPYESGLERDYFIQMSAQKGFLRLTWNPIELEYVDSEDRTRTYTPDALLEFELGSEYPRYLLVELKYREELRKDIAKFRDGFYAARQYAAQFAGWRFEVRTEWSICATFVSNTTFLSRYRSIPLDGDESDYPVRLFEELQARGCVTAAHLVAVVGADRVEQANAIPYMWAMVANGVIECDLNSKLTMSSLLWIN